jgi:hypothetical protein
MLDGVETALTAPAKFYAVKRYNGMESYQMYAPIARKTTLTRKLPAKGNCGFRQTPTGFGSDLPTGYVWLKTADDATRTGSHGKWERREDWTGAHYWDTDIYPVGP